MIPDYCLGLFKTSVSLFTDQISIQKVSFESNTSSDVLKGDGPSFYVNVTNFLLPNKAVNLTARVTVMHLFRQVMTMMSSNNGKDVISPIYSHIVASL